SGRDLSVWALHVLPMFAWVLSRYSDLLPRSKNMQLVRQTSNLSRVKQVSVMNVLSNRVHSVNNQSLQQQTGNLMAEVPSVATFKEKSGMPVKLLNPLPVTVKSPALPRGQYLQIPPNAQVQTVPACRLPAAIQKQIFTSSASSSSGSALPSVVYVTPVTTINQGGTLPTDTAPHSVRITQQKTASQLSQDNGAQGQENALVMCNGKVFFVAKRCTPLSKTTTTTKASELSKSILPPSSSLQQFLQSAVTSRDKPPPFPWKQKFFSGQSSHNRASCDCKSKQETDCLEPGGEDVPTTNEGSISQSQYADAHLQTQTWLDLSRNTRRIGRTRKRTVCPCCMPTTLDPAVKSRARLEELDKWDFTAEQVSKKGGRAKVPRKDGMMSCGKVTNKQNYVAHVGYSNILSTTSTDCDELKRQERIKRLKDYLTEKEAALQLMKRKVS
uniref:Ligand dependent nuclear receptor interacting factor 1 n=1 Tax=Maylandia zebra TaxID=106582 RepID=A0A3P9D4X1_9CICH